MRLIELRILTAGGGGATADTDTTAGGANAQALGAASTDMVDAADAATTTLAANVESQ